MWGNACIFYGSVNVFVGEGIKPEICKKNKTWVTNWSNLSVHFQIKPKEYYYYQSDITLLTSNGNDAIETICPSDSHGREFNFVEKHDCSTTMRSYHVLGCAKISMSTIFSSPSFGFNLNVREVHVSIVAIEKNLYKILDFWE